MKKWTDEQGEFFIATGIGRWDLGTWSQRGISESGMSHASVQVWRYHNGSCTVGVHASASLTPEKARQLARVLIAAADKAEARRVHACVDGTTPLEAREVVE